MEQDHIKQLEILKTAVKELDGRFDKQDTKLDKQDEKLAEIYNAITGNEKFGNSGLVKRIEILEKDKAEWDKRYYKAVGFMLAGWVILTGFQIFLTLKFGK